MASLSAITVNLVGSVLVFSVSMILFGQAVKNQSTFIASRCEARPPCVIYNPNPNRHPCQNRGSPTFGWIPWTMGLTYETMLKGVPGTGTRNDGLSGALLKVNLDGIILLRFHHLCLRVCCLACFLYLVVVLPLYATAHCSRIGGDYGSLDCGNDHFYTSIYSYERLTLANVPMLDPSRGHVVSNFFLPEHGGILARLYAVVFVTWIVTFYVLREFKTEWGDVLALRRVYYLEADLWKDRKEELEQTLLMVEREKTERRHSMQHTHIEKDESYLVDRKPWIPHPEQRDTVPNIELYSVLVGGLPSLPTHVFDYNDAEATFSRKQSIDWQLAVTTAFFDHCVPNQPGYSSSIAAVTVLPSASHLTEAWNQWYKVAAKLRRLRFIRREINKRTTKKKKRRRKKMAEQVDIETGNAPPQDTQLESLAGVPHSAQKYEQIGVYTQTEEKNEYFQEVLGATGDLQVEDRLLDALHFGPEQIAAYAREFAFGAANLAPYGWHERRVLNASLSELLMMERAAVEAVREANIALREAQERIGEDASGPEGADLSVDNIHEIMRNVEIPAIDPDDSEMFPVDYISTSAGSHPSQAPRRPSRVAGATFTGYSGSNTSLIGSTDDEASFDDGSFGHESSHEYQVELHDEDKTTKTRLMRSNSTCSSRTGGSSSEGSSVGRRSVSRRVDRKNRRSVSRASIRSTKLPGNLGLEAGLWIEQTTQSGNSESGDRRTRAPRGSKSALGHSMHGLHGHHGNHHALRTRTKSSDEIDTLLVTTEGTESKPMKRALSSGDIDLVVKLSEGEKMSSTANASWNKSPDDGTNQLELKKESIWERLNADKDRRQSIRNRLRNIQIADKDRASVQSVPADDNPLSVNTMASTATLGELKSISMNQPGKRQDLSDVGPSVIRAVQTNCESNHEKISPYLQSQSSQQHIPLSTQASPLMLPRTKRLDESHMDDDLSVDIHRHGKGKTIFGGPLFQGTMEDSHRSLSSVQIEENLRIALDFEEKAGLRHRDVGAPIHDGEAIEELDDKWTRVKAIVQEAETGKSRHGSKGHVISSGSWKLPTCRELFRTAKNTIRTVWTNCTRMQPSELVDELVRDSYYAVVTFTSRQAAVAARHCLADSRGHDRWITVSEIPSPPLADAPVFNVSSFRGCVRPVTLSISDKQKIIRHTLAMGCLAAIYFFYTIPLTLAQQLVSPEHLSKIFPEIEELQENSMLLYNIFSGLIPALVWTAFFAACPPMFKIIANFGSNATSSATAENSALHYFWWFMLLSAFTGTSFSTAVIDGFRRGLNIGIELQKVIETTAETIPKQVSAAWLNWMIIRVFAVLPTQYLLQLNTYVFSCLGLQCCARSVRGGGAGGPVPYRLYVDSGVVMLCVFALAPASPLIAASAFAYFVFCTPMLRWTLIFLYRPKFDLGGGRFPFIFDVCITGIIAGQIFLIAMMVLKRAIGPAVAAFCPMVPTIWFRHFIRKRYLRAFSDAALLQTSLLDGWDTNIETSMGKREDFRKFLVDCHKAAYVPVCIAGDQSSMITAEPAVVVPVEFDDDDAIVDNIHSYGAQIRKAEDVAASVQQQTGTRARHSHRPLIQNMPMMRRTRAYEAHQEPGSPLRALGSFSPNKNRVIRREQQLLFSSPPLSSTPNSLKIPLSPLL